MQVEIEGRGGRGVFSQTDRLHRVVGAGVEVVPATEVRAGDLVQGFGRIREVREVRMLGEVRS